MYCKNLKRKGSKIERMVKFTYPSLHLEKINLVHEGDEFSVIILDVITTVTAVYLNDILMRMFRFWREVTFKTLMEWRNIIGEEGCSHYG